MNNSHLFPGERVGGPSRPPLGEDLLPPVEEPSARFIIQLFVVPALIVLGIVALWLSFTWIVRRTSADPQDLIQGLEQGSSIARSQRASDLAFMLPNKRYAELRRNGSAAAELGRILTRQIEEGGMQQGDIEFRNFLARALGVFEAQDGVAALIKAAETNRDPREQTVRDAALQAIAGQAYRLHQLDPPQQLAHPDLEPALFRLADDEDPKIRFQTAYALSHVGTPAAMERLEAMVDDPDLDTRSNAAIALANHGNAAAVETLADMLDIDELARAHKKSDEQHLDSNPVVFVQPAMAAAEALARKNSKADLAPIIAALRGIATADSAALAQANLTSVAVSNAKRALRTLEANK